MRINKKLFASIFVGLAFMGTVSYADVHGSPSKFSIKCGDWALHVPSKQWDEGFLSKVVVEGTATQLNSSDLPGYYANGTGYKLTVAINDRKITGLKKTLIETFNCYARENSESLICNGSLQSLPSVSEFNILLLQHLPLPTELLVNGGRASGPSIGVRTATEIRSSSSRATIYHDYIREMNCIYSP